MKATCPNDSTHKKFTTTVHVMETWVVDEDGEFIEALETLQTTSGPDIRNIWNCEECGAQATVTCTFKERKVSPKEIK